MKRLSKHRDAIFASDAEVDLIPKGLKVVAHDGQSISSAQHFYDNRLMLADEFIASLPRQQIPVRSLQATAWLNWLWLDSRHSFQLSKNIKFRESIGANLFASPAPRKTNYRTFRLDVREAYATFQPNGRLFLTLGRYNLKNGVASGFNPTDFFRTASVRLADTNDVMALRESRLGTFMAYSEFFGNIANISLAVAPQLSSRYDRGYYLVDDAFHMGLARTNPTWRQQIQVSFPKLVRFAPSLIVYHDASAVKFGASSAFLLTDKATGYIEWAGWNRSNIVTDGLEDAFKAGLLRRVTYQDGDHTHFRQQVVAGISYSFTAKFSLSFEFHYSGGGLTRSALRNFTRYGQSRPDRAAAYWAVRQYSLVQQDPLAQKTGFLRASWTDALIKNMDLSAISLTNLDDFTSSFQMSASYRFNHGWVVGLQGNYTTGEKAGEYASLPQAGALLTRINKYF